jgi:hypothetical protein
MSINRTIPSGRIGQYGVKITWTDMGTTNQLYARVCRAWARRTYNGVQKPSFRWSSSGHKPRLAPKSWNSGIGLPRGTAGL